MGRANHDIVYLYRCAIPSLKEFAKSGGRLRSLTFPKTQLQAYGTTAIIYTTYELETERGGERRKESGTATEIFVLRGRDWLNTGWHLAPRQAN